MDVRWWIAIVLILISVYAMLVFGIWKISFIFWIDGLCVVLSALVVIIIISTTFQPLFCISSRNGIYF